MKIQETVRAVVELQLWNVYKEGFYDGYSGIRHPDFKVFKSKFRNIIDTISLIKSDVDKLNKLNESETIISPSDKSP